LSSANLSNAVLEEVELNQAVLTGANVKGARIKKKERKAFCPECGQPLDKTGKCAACLAEKGKTVAFGRSFDLSPLLFFFALLAGPLTWVLDSTLYYGGVENFAVIFMASLAAGLVISALALILGFSPERKNIPAVKGARVISIFNCAAWIAVAIIVLFARKG
jgi:hypothetical protein